MKAMVVAVILMGFLAFWGFLVFRQNMAERSALRAEAVAANYVMFREAVLDFVFFTLDPAATGTIVPGDPALELPQGWTALAEWRALLQTEEDGARYCYIYGPARPEEIVAVRKLLNNSLAVGWNDGGLFSNNGWPLPADVGSGDIVSVIRIDDE